MAITTHAELVTAIGNWTQRDDLSSRAPEYITLAEAAFNRGFSDTQPFRHFSQEATTQVSTATTLGLTVGFPLPTDFLELRQIRSTTAPFVPLQYIPPEAANAKYTSSTTGAPRFFTMEAGIIRCLPPPSNGVQLTYYQKITALSGGSNWLIASHPDVYLFGALLHGGVFAHDDPQLQKVIAGYNAAVNSLRQSSQSIRFGGGALQMFAA